MVEECTKYRLRKQVLYVPGSFVATLLRMTKTAVLLRMTKVASQEAPGTSQGML